MKDLSNPLCYRDSVNNTYLGTKNGTGIEKLFYFVTHQVLTGSNLGAISGMSSELTLDLFCMDFFPPALQKNPFSIF